MPDEIEVGYSVKELIKGLSDRIDSFMQMMASKADQTAVSQVQVRVDNHESRILTLEHEAASSAKNTSAKSEFRRWVIPVILSLVTAGVLILQVLHP